MKDGATTTVQTSSELWKFQVVCPEHDFLSALYDCYEKNGLSPTVNSIYELDDNVGSIHGLSES